MNTYEVVLLVPVKTTVLAPDIGTAGTRAKRLADSHDSSVPETPAIVQKVLLIEEDTPYMSFTELQDPTTWTPDPAA